MTWRRSMSLRISAGVSRGFTLVEMAVVLVILGLLLGGMLVPIGAQIDQKNYSDTRKALEEAKEALIGFALVKGYLPCPAISFADGRENRSGGVCNTRSGFLPWAELGVRPVDSWGHLYRYSVTPAFANAASPIIISPLTNRDVTIQTRNAAGGLENLSNVDDIPAMIMSFGKNGSFATTKEGVLLPNASATNLDESNNAVNERVFVARDVSTNTTAGGGEFDDIVVWISPNIYTSRMVAAGRLP